MKRPTQKRKGSCTVLFSKLRLAQKIKRIMPIEVLLTLARTQQNPLICDGKYVYFLAVQGESYVLLNPDSLQGFGIGDVKMAEGFLYALGYRKDWGKLPGWPVMRKAHTKPRMVTREGAITEC